MSYDAQAILKEFSDRQGITYPLIADPHSEIIKRFDVLNPDASGFMKGMAFPGFVYISRDGRVQKTFFERDYKQRYTGNSVVAKLFPELTEGDVRTMSAPNLRLRLAQSDSIVGPGSRVTLTLELELPNKVHVYAPGVTGYKPIALQLDSMRDAVADSVHYPKPEVLFLPAINEKVPVFSHKFKITQDVTFSVLPAFIQSLRSSGTAGKPVTLNGKLFYQACDDKKCFLLQTVAVSWPFTAVPLDGKRSPQAIQHTANR